MPPVSIPEIAVVSCIAVALVVALFWVVRPKGSNRAEDDPTLFIRRGHIARLAPFRATAASVAPRAIASAPLAITATRDRDSTVGVLLARGDGRLRFPTTCENCRDGNHRQHVRSNGMCFNEWCACPPRTVWR